MPFQKTPTPDLKKLKKYQPRVYVPADADLTVLEQVEKLYQALLDRPLNSSKDLEAWIKDQNELESTLSQTGTILYIQMTCQTDDQSRAIAYQQFIKIIQPPIKNFSDKLNKKYLKEQKRFNLNPPYYYIYTRAIQTDINLFVPENVFLQTKIDLLTQEYQTIVGAMTVTFEGKEQTLPQMAKFLYEPNRDLRERAWKAVAARRLWDKDKLEKLFDQLLSLRVTLAHNAGCSGFCEYKFRSLHRFDYSPQDCKKYHQSIEELVVPIWQEILKRRKLKMGLDSLRPWDTAVDPLTRPALHPFNQICQLTQRCQDIFNRLDPELGKNFHAMLTLGVLDLESRKGKAPGGYQSTLDEARMPFIFMNAVGIDDDVRTLLHEAGHAFHALACNHDPLLHYRHGPMEFNEVASMGMELLADGYLSAFYNPEDEQRSRQEHWEGIVSLLIWVAVIDAFQHWIYEHPGHTPLERQEAWLKIHQRFNPQGINWNGLEEERSFLWHRQLHVFEVPFYYIEYGIAQLGALQLWNNFQKNPKIALEKYKKALSLGGSKPLPELFGAAGIHFDFSSSTITPLIEIVKKQLQ